MRMLPGMYPRSLNILSIDGLSNPVLSGTFEAPHSSLSSVCMFINLRMCSTPISSL